MLVLSIVIYFVFCKLLVVEMCAAKLCVTEVTVQNASCIYDLLVPKI